MIKMHIPVVALTFVSGCTFEYPLGQVHQSNFTYPESYATPIKNVSAEASESTIGTFMGVSTPGYLKDKAIDEALGSVPEANVLINYYEELTTTAIPLIFLPLVITTNTYRVEGVAAKAEVN
jgi:hypothetical protein